MGRLLGSRRAPIGIQPGARVDHDVQRNEFTCRLPVQGAQARFRMDQLVAAYAPGRTDAGEAEDFHRGFDAHAERLFVDPGTSPRRTLETSVQFRCEDNDRARAPLALE